MEVWNDLVGWRSAREDKRSRALVSDPDPVRTRNADRWRTDPAKSMRSSVRKAAKRRKTRINRSVETKRGELDEALRLVDETDERWCEAELYRLKGESLLSQNLRNAEEATQCFRNALATARAQGAKAWELRATASLARLLNSQGRRTEAREMLADIYNWFTEGFDTADLKDARALLDELSV